MINGKFVIILGSKNVSKNAGFKKVSQRIWPDAFYESIKIENSVSNNSLSIDETIQNAINGAKYCLDNCKKADLGVGIENGVYKDDFRIFLTGCVIILDRFENYSIGLDNSVRLPDSLAKRLELGETLNQILQNTVTDTNYLRTNTENYNFLTTSTIQLIEYATKRALPPFISKDLYSKNIFKL